MEKIDKLSKKENFETILSNDFRSILLKELGVLDTATSFMYLFVKFGVPTFSNKDEYKILYDYRFKHEDLIISIHASYRNHVMFSLSIPSKRFNEWRKKRTTFFSNLYKKYKKEVYMPYSILPYARPDGLSEIQHKNNWKLIDVESELFFSKKDNLYIEQQFKSKNPNKKLFEMLSPFEDKLCSDFRKKLTKSELNELNNFVPKIKDIVGLKKQCFDIINDLKKGVYVRDVAINILGYEGENNEIKSFD
jgi:hypothetical protein